VFFQQLPALHQRLVHHVLALEDQNVEDEEVERGAAGAVVLQQVERRPAFGIESDDLAVDDRLVGDRRQRLDETRVPRAEVLVVARPELQPAGVDGESAIAVERAAKGNSSPALITTMSTSFRLVRSFV
jgi:hypothetical protein